jgi:hypothetical protein
VAYSEIFICTGLLVYWLSRVPSLLRQDEAGIDFMIDEDRRMVRWFFALLRLMIDGPTTL